MKKYIIPLLILFVAVLPIYYIRIENIEISGNKEDWITADQIKEELFSDDISKLTILNVVSEMIGVHRKAKFVEDYDLEWKSANSAVVHIRHKKIVGCVRYVNSFMYFDKDGTIVENSNRKLSGIPEVVGLEFASVYLNEKLDMYDRVAFTEILDIIRNLNSYSIPADVVRYSILARKTREEFERDQKEENAERTKKSKEKAKGEFDETQTTVLMTEEARVDMLAIDDTVIVRDQLSIEVGGLIVSFGSTDLLSGKLAELKGMLENISNLNGVVHLEHFDGKEGNKYYTFERK